MLSNTDDRPGSATRGGRRPKTNENDQRLLIDDPAPGQPQTDARFGELTREQSFKKDFKNLK